MKALKTILTLTSCLALSMATVACSGDDDDSSSNGDGDGTGGTETGDGDGDGTGGTESGDGDGSGGTGMGGSPADCSTILELAAATDDLSSLVAAVEAAGLTDALKGDDLTVFAPTNAAFADLLDALGLEFSDLTADNLIPILTYHVADSVVDSAAAIGVAESNDNTFGTLGGTITLTVEEGDLVLDIDEAAATVVTPDIEACNGIIHIVDAVILPSVTDIVVSQDRFSGLETLIGASDTDPTNVAAALDGPSADGAWTLFAPDNAAVDALLALNLGLTAENVTTALLYHAYSSATAVDAATAVTLVDTDITTAGGELLTVDGDANAGTVTLTDGASDDHMVTVTDIYASNGIIHVIDGVLIPPTLGAPQ